MKKGTFAASVMMVSLLAACDGGDSDPEDDRGNCLAESRVSWTVPECDAVFGMKGLTFAALPDGPVPYEGPTYFGDAFVIASIVSLGDSTLLAIEKLGGRGVSRSDDSGCTWTLLGRSEQYETLIAAGGQAYVVGGEGEPTWRIEGENIGAADIGDLRVQWVDPCDGGHLLALRTPESAIFESRDAGESWTEVGHCPGNEVFGLAVDATDPDHLGCRTDDAVPISRDGGRSWHVAEGLLSPGEHEVIRGLEFSAIDGSIVWVTQGGALYRSEDGGSSFSRVLEEGGSSRLHPDDADPGRVWYESGGGLVAYDVGQSAAEVVVSGNVFGSEVRIESFLQTSADPEVLYLGLWHNPSID